jgi:hypothetical protein
MVDAERQLAGSGRLVAVDLEAGWIRTLALAVGIANGGQQQGGAQPAEQPTSRWSLRLAALDQLGPSSPSPPQQR